MKNKHALKETDQSTILKIDDCMKYTGTERIWVIIDELICTHERKSENQKIYLL